VVSEPAERSRKASGRVVSAGAFVVIAAVALLLITLGAILLGYSVTTSLLLGLALSSPACIVLMLLVWAFEAIFRNG
jgi:uncharacterized membrane protein